MTKRPFGYDPYTGATETFDYDESSDTCVIQRSENVAPLLEQNKRAQSEAREEVPGLGTHMAAIPNAVIYEWLTKYGVNFWDKNHWPAVKQLLNSNEYRWIRVNHMIM